MDGKQTQQKQRRGSNHGNVGNEKGKKSKRSKRNKTRKKSSIEGPGSENDVLPLISNLNLKDTDTGADSDASRQVKSNQDGCVSKSSSSASQSSENDDNKMKDTDGDTDVKQGKRSPLWLTDSVIKEHFLKFSDQASDFDEPVWKSVKSTLSQKAFKSLSARYNVNGMTLPRFDRSCPPAHAESLRWELMTDDAAEEQERLRIYKINRRKRFLAERHAKGLKLTSSIISNNSPTDVLQKAISTSYLEMNGGTVLTEIIKPLGLNGGDDGREMVLNCS